MENFPPEAPACRTGRDPPLAEKLITYNAERNE